MNENYLDNLVQSKLLKRIEELKQYDLNNRTVAQLRLSDSWIKKNFENQISNFYDSVLNNAILGITLPKYLDKEIYLLNWVELQGPAALTSNSFPYIQEELFRCKSPFYLRLNYYQYMVYKDLLEPQIIFNDFINVWESFLVKRIYEYRLAQIQAKRAKFLSQAYHSLEIAVKYNVLLKTVFNFFGSFWKFEELNPRQMNFSVLEKFAQYLEEDPAIMQIARLLGRLSGVSEFIEERVYDKVVIKERWEPIGIYKEEIVGVTQSKDLEQILPHEIAMLNDPVLNLIFLKKFVEGRLLSLQPRSDERVVYPTIAQEVVQLPVPEEKGPFIIALDTSKSMQGVPEVVAKSLALAIIKIALRENRACYVINFSNTLDVYDFTSPNRNVADFINLITYRFSSNTNIEPALMHAFNVMNFNEFYNADLLMISDLAAPDIPAVTSQEVNRLKARRNRFHAITIGNIANPKLSEIFDNNWVYNPRDPFTAEHIISTLEKQFIANYANINLSNLFQNTLQHQIISSQTPGGSE